MPLLVIHDWSIIAAAMMLTGAFALVIWIEWRVREHRSAAERQFRVLMDASPFAIAITRRDTGAFVFVNRAAIDLLGLSPTGFHSQHILYDDPVHDRARLLADIRRHGRVVHHEGVMMGYDGRRFPFIASVAPIRFDGIDALLGAFDDISTIKDAEQRTRTSEARLRAVFETAPDGIAILSPDGTIRQASESCVTLLALPGQEKAIGHRIFDFLDPADHRAFGELLADLQSSAAAPSTVFHITHADGIDTWVEPRAVRLTDPVSHDATILVVFRNITQRREAQEALATRAAELQSALDRIAHLQNEIVRVCAWTKEVNVDGKWIPIDHYLAKYLGLKVSHGLSEKGMEMLGLSPEETPPVSPPTPCQDMDANQH